MASKPRTNLNINHVPWLAYLLYTLLAIWCGKLNEMNVISTTVEYKGMPVKVENGKIFLRAFGTTIYNHSMHWSWMEVKASDLKSELRELLKEKGLIWYSGILKHQ